MQSDLGLLDDDIPILMAAAEEDQNGRLLYDEFVPVGIDIAEALLIRRSTRQGQERAAGERGGEEAESIVHGLSASALRETLETACSEFGIGADDQLSRSDLRDLLLTLHLNLTKLEVNSVLARVREDFVSMQQFVQRFPAILEQISQNAILLNDAGDLETVLLRQFQACDVDGADTVLTSQLRDVLLHLPRVTLSRAQVYTIMAEAEADAGGLVSYRSFARAAAACIRRMLEPRSVEMRRELLFGSDTSAAQLLGGREKAALEIELREQFAECDPDANGVLEIAQFRRCLESATLGLTPRQGTALVNVADISDDGQIDYFEFVRFAYDVLLTMAREVKLQEMLDAQR